MKLFSLQIQVMLAMLTLWPIYATPETVSDFFYRGNDFFHQANYQAAIKNYENALAINSHATATQFNLALTLAKVGAWNAAIKHYKTVIHQQPDNVGALYQLAHTLKENHQPHKAIEMYQQVIKHEPDHAFAHMGLAQCYLIIGEFDKGWPHLAWRSPAIRTFQQYQWKACDLSDTTILIRAEWGLGDMIQFIRFAQLLKKQRATVVLQAYPALAQLLSLCPYVDNVVCSGQPLPTHDCQIPLLDLARALNITIDDIPQDPYLHADPNLAQQWHQYFEHLQDDDPHTVLRIGVCWAGRGATNIPPGLQKKHTAYFS